MNQPINVLILNSGSRIMIHDSATIRQGAMHSEIVAVKPTTKWMDGVIVLEHRQDTHTPWMTHEMRSSDGDTFAGHYHATYEDAMADFLAR